MILRRPLLSWLPLGAFVALGLLTLAAVPPAAAEPSREQQIADLERQIADLTKKLEELRKAPTAPEGTIPADWTKALTWRSIGPAAMGGRITALAVFEADPSTYWVATASGGLLKTTNNGTTFEHQFDHESTVSIGSVCVAPSDRNIVWVGTGENNPRNSVSYGDGVYKSTDGGKSWKNMGLKETFQIGRVLVHPTDPNTVYVGALGRLYGPNMQRGLFKTTDGGKTWQQILYLDDKTGIIDVQMSPADPETLLVAAWDRQRDEFDSHRGEPPLADGYDAYDPSVKWGAKAGIYRTTDGGKSFHKVTQGLPTGSVGRIGIDWYRKDPRTVFAIIDSDKIGTGLPPPFLGIDVEGVEGGLRLKSVRADASAGKAGLKAGDIVKKVDNVEVKNLDQIVEILLDHAIGEKLTFQVLRDKDMKDFVVTLDKVPEEPIRAYAGIRAESKEDRGLRLVEVAPEGAAAKAGLKIDDMVLALDKKDIKGAKELAEELQKHKPGDKVVFRIRRDKEEKDIPVTLGEAPRTPPPTRPYSFMYSGQRDNVQKQQGPDGYQTGGIYKSTDAGETWTRLNSLNPRPMYFSQVRVDPSDERYLYVLGVALYRSSDGGKRFKPDGDRGVHPDQHALWIDPKDGRHMIVGCDGGFYVTYDRMEHWDFLNTMAIGQFYHVCVDSRQPYHVYGGLQDNGSWGGPSRSLSGTGPINEDWIMVAGGDGFVCRVDATDPDVVYFESQDGNMGRRNLRTNEGQGIGPGGGGRRSYRFNWNTPFLLSHHNSRIFYCGGNYVFRSVEQGKEMRVISPEITRTKRGSATALAESPRNPDVLWAGTDDGALWVTRDGGTNWTNVSDKIGLPGPRWVASIEASRFVEGRAYVVFDAHRSNDDAPYVYVTEDFGETWKSLRANLPNGSTRVLREDVPIKEPKDANPNLLFLGTEFGVWVSLNRGTTWTKLNNNLPTVAVHELAIHAASGEMVAATHGRSLWVLDISPLRGMKAEALKAKAYLYEPSPAVRWRSEPQRGTIYGAGSRFFVGENPPYGAQIYYSLTQKPKEISLKIVDYAGKEVRKLPVHAEPGLHHVIWNLASVGEGGRRPTSSLLAVPPGMYRVVLTVDGEELTQGVRVEADPVLPNARTAEEPEEKEDRD